MATVETSDPVLVEVTRGGRIESVHRGAIAIVDARGRTRAAVGRIKRVIYPRSSIKLIQALPLVETGAADRFGFSDVELALALASHTGEPDHIEEVRNMLARAGFGEDDLECGETWPMDRETALVHANQGGTKTQLHNPCSGKHAGMLATARMLGESPIGYSRPEHPVQRRIADILADLTQLGENLPDPAVDGCSVPTWPIQLDRLAHVFARLGTGSALSSERVRATRRLMAAAFAQPFFVAGTGRLDTVVMRSLPGVAFIKTGAEGVYCAALPEDGLGIAIKCADGAQRAGETAMVAALVACLPDSREGLAPHLVTTVRNAAGRETGTCQPASGLVDALRPFRSL